MENYEWFLKTRELVAASDESSDIWLPELPGKQIDSGEVLSARIYSRVLNMYRK
jgi:hypothetical protein